MASRLLNINYNSTVNGRNLLQNMHRMRPLADVENNFQIYFENDPFNYRNIIRTPNASIIDDGESNCDEFDVVARLAKSAPTPYQLKSFSATKLDKSELRNLNTKSAALIKKQKNSKKSANQYRQSSFSGTPKHHHQQQQQQAIKENQENQFMVIQMDEYKYHQQKKEIKKQLHDYWNHEFIKTPRKSRPTTTQQEKEKEKDKEKENWVKIVNNPDTNTDVFMNTFTGVDTADPETVYQVNNDTGAMIAQKINEGVKIMIGKNGEPVETKKKVKDEKEEDEKHDNLTPKPDATPKPEDTGTNRDSLKKLFDDMNPVASLPLSWNDQVVKKAAKVLSPRKLEEKTNEKILHERKIFYKKLVDEEDFKPKLKVEIPAKFTIAQTIKPKKNPAFGKNDAAKVTSVEVVGINNVAKFEPEISFVQQYTTPPGTANTIPSLIGNPVDDILSEKQYNQIIDNLTSQYLSNKKQDSAKRVLSGRKLTNLQTPLMRRELTVQTVQSSHLTSNSALSDEFTNEQITNHNLPSSSKIHVVRHPNALKIDTEFTKSSLPSSLTEKTNNSPSSENREREREVRFADPKRNFESLIIRTKAELSNEQIKSAKLNQDKLRILASSSINRNTVTHHSLKQNKMRQNKLKDPRSSQTIFINLATSIAPTYRASSYSKHHRHYATSSFSLPDNPGPSRVE